MFKNYHRWGEGRLKIAKSLGISESVVKRCLKKMIKVTDEEVIESICLLHADGKKVKEIAHLLKISIGQVFSALHTKSNATQMRAAPTYDISADISMAVENMWLANIAQNKICTSLNLPISIVKKLIRQFKKEHPNHLVNYSVFNLNDSVDSNDDGVLKYDLFISPIKVDAEIIFATHSSEYDWFAAPDHSQSSAVSLINYDQLCPALNAQDFINSLLNDEFNQPIIYQNEVKELYKEYLLNKLNKNGETAINYIAEINNVMPIFDEMYDDIIKPLYESNLYDSKAEV